MASNRFGLSSEIVGAATGTTPSAIASRRLSRGPAPRTRVDGRIADLHAVVERLAARCVSGQAIREWLESPTEYLGSEAPVTVLERGDRSVVEAAATAFASGQSVFQFRESGRQIRHRLGLCD